MSSASSVCQRWFGNAASKRMKLEVGDIGDFGDVLFADAFALVIGGLKHFRLSIGGPWGDMDLRVDRSATRAYRLRHADTVAADRDAAGFARNDGRGPDVALLPQRLPDGGSDPAADRLR